MKIFSKMVIFLIIFLTLFSTVCQVSATDIWSKASSFISTGSVEGKTEDMRDKAKPVFQKLINIIWGLGLLVVFASTAILGIKYMLVNPAEKSRVKQATVPYVIGTFIIFGALTIWKVLIQVLDS